MMYDSLDKEQDKQFLSFWIVFCLFLHPTPPPHPNNSENQTFDVRFLTWDTEHNRQSFLSFWIVFCSFTPPPSDLITPKIKSKNFKKWKKHLETLSFYTYTLMTWWTVPEIWYTTDGWADRQTDWRSEKVMYRGGCLC